MSADWTWVKLHEQIIRSVCLSMSQVPKGRGDIAHFTFALFFIYFVIFCKLSAMRYVVLCGNHLVLQTGQHKQGKTNSLDLFVIVPDPALHPNLAQPLREQIRTSPISLWDPRLRSTGYGLLMEDLLSPKNVTQSTASTISTQMGIRRLHVWLNSYYMTSLYLLHFIREISM